MTYLHSCYHQFKITLYIIISSAGKILQFVVCSRVTEMCTHRTYITLQVNSLSRVELDTRKHAVQIHVFNSGSDMKFCEGGLRQSVLKVTRA